MQDKKLPYAVTLPSVLKEKDEAEKVKLATEHLLMPFCESLLMDRARMSKENAAVLADYIIVIKREINPRASYIKNNIQFLSELSRFVGIKKRFECLHQNQGIKFQGILLFLHHHQDP